MMSTDQEIDNRPPIGVFLTMEVRDKDGKLISSKTSPSHSFVGNFLQWLCDYFNASTAAYVATWGIQGTSGPAQSVPAVPNTTAPLAYVNAPSGTTSYGLQIGTGAVQTIASAIFKLSTQATTGWTYNACVCDSGQINNPSAGVMNFNVTRSFVNNTGGTVIITEVCLTVSITNTGGNYQAVFIYDNGNSTSVPNGSTLTVKYTLQTTL